MIIWVYIDCEIRLGSQHWCISWLGGTSLCQGSLLHTFFGFPISLMDKTPLWVVSDPVYPFQETHTCIKPPYSSTVQATVSVIFRQQFVPDLFWCYAVLYVCALYARCNTVFFFSSLRKAALKHWLTFTALQDCSRFGSAQSFALGLLLHSNRHYSLKG